MTVFVLFVFALLRFLRQSFDCFASCSSRGPKNSFVSRGSTTLRLCYLLRRRRLLRSSRTDRPTLSSRFFSRGFMFRMSRSSPPTFPSTVSNQGASVIPELEPSRRVRRVLSGLQHLSLRFLSERVQQVVPCESVCGGSPDEVSRSGTRPLGAAAPGKNIFTI